MVHVAQRETAMVAGQRWRDLPVPTLGEWTPTDTLTVVLPARDNQDQLDLTLAALRHQTYPSELLEVVVVDDSSSPPLQVPPDDDRVRVVTRSEAVSHGSGAARDAGARASTSDIVLFLDSDMLADTRHIEAHARWHHVCDHALVLGRKWFVDVADVSPEQIDAVLGDGGQMDDLLDPAAPVQRHDWQEAQISAQHDLQEDSDDAFLTVVGATVSIRKEMYDHCGGFSSFGLRGIVDTEFGYRAYTSGCLIVPDADARSWHQGRRNFSTQGEQIKRARVGLAANHLPLPLFRPHAHGRQWAVPLVSALVDASEGPPGVADDDSAEALLLTVDSLLGSDVSDLAVTVLTGDRELPAWWRDYMGHDARVTVRAGARPSGFPSPVTVVVPPGLVLARDGVSSALAALDDSVRVVRTLPDELGRSVEVWRTRTLERVLRVGFDAVENSVLGEAWVAPATIGVSAPVVRVTQQGMITGW